MLKFLDPDDLAEVLEFAHKRLALTAPSGRQVEPKSLVERLWWQATARIRARIAVLPIESQRELLALCWLGRDQEVWRWDDLLARAVSTSEPATHIAAKATLHSYLVEGSRLMAQVRSKQFEPG